MATEKKITKNLRDFIVWMKYAQYRPEDTRRETFEEIIDRTQRMFEEKIPDLIWPLRVAFKHVREGHLLPSMRCLHFAGEGIKRNNARVFNCAATNIESLKDIADTMFLLLSGCGVGVGLETSMFVRKRGSLTRGQQFQYIVPDSIEGWSESYQILLECWQNQEIPLFDYSDIRPQGAEITSINALAPGPDALKKSHEDIWALIKDLDFLDSFTILRILCLMSSAVMAGGIRRSAMIAIVDEKDDRSIQAKQSATWFEDYPELQYVNISIGWRSYFKPSREAFTSMMEDSLEYGEPGFLNFGDAEWLSNPCFTGDMKLLTSEGYRSFKSLADTTPSIYNKDGQITQSKVWCSGEKPTVRVKFRKRTPITCTPDHVFMITDGSECKAKDLKGRRIKTYIDIKEDFDREDLLVGFMIGDALLSRLSSETHRGLEVYFEQGDKDIAEMWGQPVGKWYSREAYNLAEERGLPGTRIGHRGFPEDPALLSGIFSANGCVIRGHRVALKSTDLKQLKVIQELLEEYFAITSYITTNKAKTNIFSNGEYLCKTSYDLNISQYSSLLNFARFISFGQSYKRNALVDLLNKRSPQVSSVRANGVKKVYDFTEPETHWGVVEDVVVHNCAEIMLQPKSFCNLVEVNATTLTPENQDEIFTCAALLGFVQSRFTDFHFLSPEWKAQTEKERLVGVSLTGIAGMRGDVNLRQGSDTVQELLKNLNDLHGEGVEVPRWTTVKPAGHTSLIMNTSSGIHSYPAPFYLRRVTVPKNSALGGYLKNTMPAELLEQDFYDPANYKLVVPMKAPEDAACQTDPNDATDMLERIAYVNRHWIDHQLPRMTNYISATVAVGDDEVEKVINRMYDGTGVDHKGITLMKKVNSFDQPMWETITEEQYEKFASKWPMFLNTGLIREGRNNTSLGAEVACGAGGCEVE